METKVRTLQQIAGEIYYPRNIKLSHLEDDELKILLDIQVNEINMERNQIERERNIFIATFLSQYIKS